jgi:S-(hydroxymethyl)glutathione dehydrogenase / alcohol dehydrogenase
MEETAVVIAQSGQIPTLERVTLLDPGPEEVLVQIEASGICHTDIGYMEYARAYPVVVGHEGAGVVIQTGNKVTTLRVGDHVVINWQPKCGKCRWCLAGRRDLCENIHGTEEPRFYWKGAPIAAMLNAGTFAHWVVVGENGAIRVRDDIPLEKAALLGCAVATGLGAVLYTANVQPGEDVVVLGAGGVGLNVVQGARLANAGKIIAVDIAQDKLQIAQRMGATHLINSQQIDPIKQVMALTGGRGVEHVFEAVGTTQLMNLGIDMLSRGGTLTLIGAAGRADLLSFHPRRFMSMQQKMVGCIYGNLRPELDIPLFADWYMQGKLLLDELHTQTIGLKDVPGIFSKTGVSSGVRTVIQFDQ